MDKSENIIGEGVADAELKMKVLDERVEVEDTQNSMKRNDIDDENSDRTEHSENSCGKVPNSESQEEAQPEVIEDAPLNELVDKDGGSERHASVERIDENRAISTPLVDVEVHPEPSVQTQNTEEDHVSIESANKLVIPVVSIIPSTPLPLSPDGQCEELSGASIADQPNTVISSEVTESQEIEIVANSDKESHMQEDGLEAEIEDGSDVVIEPTALRADGIDPEATLLNHQAEKQVMQELIDTNVILEREIEKYKVDLKDRDSRCHRLQQQIVDLNDTISKNDENIKELEEEKKNNYADDNINAKLRKYHLRQKDLEEQLKQLARDDELKSSRLRTLDTELVASQKKLAALSDHANNCDIAYHRQHRKPPRSKACVVS